VSAHNFVNHLKQVINIFVFQIFMSRIFFPGKPSLNLIVIGEVAGEYTKQQSTGRAAVILTKPV